MKKLTLLSAVLASTLFAGTYNVDLSHSNVGFSVKHLMISNVKGSFDAFKGSFDVDEKKNALTKLEGTVQADSINTANTKRDAHLKSKDFFDVKKYPTITFKLLSLKEDRALGTLSMHGVSKGISLEVETSQAIKDPWGNQRRAVSLSGKIERKDFGLTYNSLLETGGVAIGEKVKIEVELEGILQK